jgi:hypothetical protein
MMGIMGTLGIDMRQLSCHILFILTAKIQSFCEKQRVESRKVSCRYVQNYDKGGASVGVRRHWLS